MIQTDLLENIIKKVKRHEGWRSKPYKCSTGHLTIGYGTKIDEISKEEGELLLRSRLDDILKYALPQVPEFWDLNNIRKLVYLDMLYNLGFKGFIGFKNMRKAVKEGNWHGAANEIHNSLYYKQVGIRGQENAKMMRFGNDSCANGGTMISGAA